MNKRAFSLDALRGYAIITMVFIRYYCFRSITRMDVSRTSRSPALILHFDPSFYGITWVDLVFHSFLFAMGAAFPFLSAINWKKENLN